MVCAMYAFEEPLEIYMCIYVICVRLTLFWSEQSLYSSTVLTVCVKNPWVTLSGQPFKVGVFSVV